MSTGKEIVLCFSEEDNQPIEGGLKGWVSNFHKFLTTLFSQISKGQSSIRLVSDSELDSLDFSQAGAIVVVCTEHILSNNTFVTNLNNFVEQQKKNDTLRINGISKVFKIFKRPADVDGALYSIADLISYDFYLIDALTGEAQEFKRFFGNEAERSYWMRLVDLAYDINQLIISEIG